MFVCVCVCYGFVTRRRAFSPFDAHMLVTAGNSGTIKLWRVPDELGDVTDGAELLHPFLQSHTRMRD